MMTRAIFQFWVCIYLAQILGSEVGALIIGAPGFGEKNFFPTPVKRDVTENCITVRIRTTHENDFEDVSQILSEALVDPLGELKSGFNFKLKMELLKAKAGVESLLRSRMKAIKAGMRIGRECPLEFCEADKLRFLWSHDSFRLSLEKAVQSSTEPHIWNDHNFACAPQDACWLQHKMMTAEDIQTGEIIGFCELAMLSLPPHINNGAQGGNSLLVSPTIVNLAISPRFRRMGVASKLMKTAERFVQREWSRNDLSLYVDQDNEAAVNMYKTIGFELITETESSTGKQWYMSRQLLQSELVET